MSSDIKKDFGKLVRRLRKNAVLTQEILAEITGLSVNYIGDIENGRKNISLKVMNNLLSKLDINLYELLALSPPTFTKEIMIEKIKSAYMHWKNLNLVISDDLGSRIVNFPESISENIVCYALEYTRNNTTAGDATDNSGSIIEIKATANFNRDTTSFGPVTSFDKLIFVRLNFEEDTAYIYDIGLNGKELGQLKVNKTETVADQQQQKRRPRLSLIKYIQDHDIEPIEKVYLGE